MTTLTDATTRTETQGKAHVTVISSTLVTDTIVHNLHAPAVPAQINRAVGLRPVILTVDDEAALRDAFEHPVALPTYPPQDLPRGDRSLLQH